MNKKNIDNVIQFPIENKRLDLSNIGVDPEEIMEEIRLMKKSYFSQISDVILDDALRSISCLNLEETKQETFPLETQDLILIKESIIAAMCRITGIHHPLHKIGEDELVQKFEGDVDEDRTYYSYKFKEEL